MKTFRHSGRIGDVIYSLPAVRAMGGGTLYLRPNQEFGFSEEAARALFPLLRARKYIKGAEIWNDQPFDVDLDEFRKQDCGHTNLADAHLLAFGLDPNERDKAWLAVDPGRCRITTVVFARSHTRRGVPGFWERAYELLGHCALFLGTSAEHDEFQRLVGPIKRYDAPDLLEAATLISEVEIFFGNQSAPLAIAEGLKVPVVQEQSLSAPNCTFARQNCLSVGERLDLDKVAEFAAVRAPIAFDRPMPWEEAALSLIPSGARRVTVFHPFEKRGVRLVEGLYLDFEVYPHMGAEPQRSGCIVFFEAPSKDDLAMARLRLTAGGTVVVPYPKDSLFLTDLLWRIVDRSEYHFEPPFDKPRMGFVAAEPITLPPSVVELSEAGTKGASIVALTYNSSRTIGPCLNSVIPTLGEGDELIVVDNGSSDGTRDLVGELLEGKPNACLIQNGANLGFSAGCNVGIRASRGRFVVLLNPDTIVKGDWLSGLKKRLEDQSVGAVGPVTDNVCGAQFVSSHLLPGDGRHLTTDQLAKRVKGLHAGQSLETKLLVGFCIAFRREVLGEVGLLDEDLFLGGEDLEISLRLRVHGYRLVIAGDVFVHHAGGASFEGLEPGEREELLAASTAALHAKLRALFAPGSVPPSAELFGCPILPPDTYIPIPTEEERAHVA